MITTSFCFCKNFRYRFIYSVVRSRLWILLIFAGGDRLSRHFYFGNSHTMCEFVNSQAVISKLLISITQKLWFRQIHAILESKISILPLGFIRNRPSTNIKRQTYFLIWTDMTSTKGYERQLLARADTIRWQHLIQTQQSVFVAAQN